jgi:Flp pilus assembly protein TadD
MKVIVMKTFLSVTVGAVILFTLSGCGQTADQKTGASTTSASALTSLTDNVRQIKGEDAKIVVGAESELYRVIDPEAGVVCYTLFANRAISCLPLSQTKLGNR